MLKHFLEKNYFKKIPNIFKIPTILKNGSAFFKNLNIFLFFGEKEKQHKAKKTETFEMVTKLIKEL